ncbi:MAG: triose-phosphate isomerase, partial [Bdellovibrio sp.]
MASSTRKLIAGNWKLNLGPSATTRFFEKCREMNLANKAEALIFPSTLSLESASRLAGSCGIALGLQNFHWEAQGAYTGENSLLFARELGAEWALVGHSERRRIFGENEDNLVRKLRFAVACRFNTIFCIGESLEERETGLTEKVLRQQLEALSSIYNEENSKNLRQVVAYEPVWAIGTGKIASLQQIRDTHEFVSNACSELLGIRPPLLYGGSVAPENSAQI